MLRQTFWYQRLFRNSGARIPELVNYLGDKYNYNPGFYQQYKYISKW
jgi:hypothetical protein